MTLNETIRLRLALRAGEPARVPSHVQIKRPSYRDV